MSGCYRNCSDQPNLPNHGFLNWLTRQSVHYCINSTCISAASLHYVDLYISTYSILIWWPMSDRNLIFLWLNGENFHFHFFINIYTWWYPLNRGLIVSQSRKWFWKMDWYLYFKQVFSLKNELHLNGIESCMWRL